MMRKRSLLYFLLTIIIAFASVSGIIVAQAETEAETTFEMNTVLATTDDSKNNGEGKVSTTEDLSDEYSIEYNVKGVCPTNGWIGTQYLGYGDDSYLSINLFVADQMTVSKVTANGTSLLTILDSETDEQFASARSLELGGVWFSGQNYILKYVVSATKLEFVFGAEGGEIKARAYVALDNDIYQTCTDGKAVFIPYSGDVDGYKFTFNSIKINDQIVGLSMDAMTKNGMTLSNESLTINGYSNFENGMVSGNVAFALSEQKYVKWVSPKAINVESFTGLSDSAEIFVTSFDLKLTTSNNRYLPSGLKFGFAFGLSNANSELTEDGVVSFTSKLPYTGLDYALGNGSTAEVDTEKLIGESTSIFSVNEAGISTLHIDIVGQKGGDMTVTYTANTTVLQTTFEDVDYNGYFTFFVDVDNISNATEITNGMVSFENVVLPSYEKIQVESITLSSSSLSIDVGETASVESTILPKNATNKALTYSSSNTEVATVDEQGVVTAVSAGYAVITVEADNEVQATCNILVPVYAEEITTTKDLYQIGKGRTEVINYSVLPEATTDKTVTFTSNDTDVATVQSDGTITAVDLGETTIKIETENGIEKVVSVQVVEPVTSVELDFENKEVTVGETVQLTAYVIPANAFNKEVIWSSSNESIATCDENGLVTTLKAGNVVITATTKEGLFTKDCNITVKALPKEVESISVDNRLTLKVGNTKTLSVTITPTDADYEQIEFSSNNTDCVSVDAEGKLTAKKAGSATITVTVGEKSSQCIVTVEEDAPTSSSGCGSNVDSLFGLMSVILVTAFVIARKNIKK